MSIRRDASDDDLLGPDHDLDLAPGIELALAAAEHAVADPDRARRAVAPDGLRLEQVRDTEELGHNQLVIRVQSDEGVTLKFGSKVPGSAMEVRDVSMDFLYGEAFTESSPEAYERLILDVLLGDSTLFPRNAEVEASWAVLDPLEEFWAGTEPQPYRAGEWGPRAADEMLAAEGRRWRRP